MANDFSGATQQVKVFKADGSTTLTQVSALVPGSTLHLRPEIDLINPTPASGMGSINGGNITVASNFNLGAGSFDSSGNFDPFFRTTGSIDAGEPGVLTLAAANNVQINATISDGFFEPSDPFSVAQVPSDASTLATVISNFGLDENFDVTAFNTVGGGGGGEPGMPAGLAAPPPGATVFPPGWNLADEEVYYGEIYNNYIQTFANLGRNSNPAISTNPAADFRTVGATGAVFDNNPADYSSYAAYVSAFNMSYVGKGSVAGEPTTITGFVDDPMAAVYGSNYANYLTAYNNYAAALVSFSTAFYKSNPTGLVPPPLAPLPPSSATSNYFSDYESYIATYGNYAKNQVEPGNVSHNSAGAHAADSLYLVVLPFLPAPADVPNPMIDITPQAAGPGNAIANNPAVNTNSTTSLADLNTTSAASLMPVAISGQGSFSYNFVAGSQFTASGNLAANPDVVIAAPAGTVTTGPAYTTDPNTGELVSTGLSDSVTIDGHASYTNPNQTLSKTTQSTCQLWFVPAPARSISSRQAASKCSIRPRRALLYGRRGRQSRGGFRSPTPPLITNLNYQPIGMISNPAWGVGGGAVTISAGSDIVEASRRRSIATAVGQA